MLNLNIFTTKVNGFKVFCVDNSSYSFMLSPLKLYRCLRHGLKMCISFGYNPQIIFCHNYHKLNLAIFTANMNGFNVFVLTTPPTDLCRFL